MAYTLRQAERVLKPFSGLPYHGLAVQQLAAVPDGPELKARTRRVAEAFAEYRDVLTFCGRL